MKTFTETDLKTTSKAVANNVKNYKPTPLNTPALQTQLQIGKPGDKYEQEADAMANKVMSMPESSVQQQPLEKEEEGLMCKLQLQPVEEEEEMLQPKWIQKVGCSTCGEQEMPEVQTSTQTIQMSPLSHIESCSGQALPDSSRGFFEPRFRHSFSKVKVHTCDSAVQMNQQLGAQAFTYGNNIFFNKGKYNPGSSDGKKLLAHELTHVVQQGGGLKKVVRQVAHTYTFISRSSYGNTRPGLTGPSCAAGVAAGTSTLVAGSAAPIVTVFPNGTYSVRRDDGIVQTATCTRLAAGLTLTRAHENSHAAGARAGVAAANTARGLPRNFATAAACTTALPGIRTPWITSVHAAWANERAHGPGTNPPTAQTFTQENAAGTCTFV